MEAFIEETFQEIEKALIEAIKATETAKQIYACGFWLFYCDYSVISPPCFGYNSDFEDNDERWAPPEWDVDVDDSMYNALATIYDSLTKRMDGKSDEEWEELLDYQWDFYSKLCFKLNSDINSGSSPFNNWSKSSDFVIGIFEEREGEEIYKKLAINSVGKAKAIELCII